MKSKLELDIDPLYVYEQSENNIKLNIHINSINTNIENGTISSGNGNGNNNSNNIKIMGFNMNIDTNYISIVANTMNGLLGVSIFAIPWGFAMSGLLGGIFIVLVVSWLAFETIRILLIAQKALYQKTGRVYTYPELAVELLDNELWSPIVKGATIISCLGCCTSYIIFYNDLYLQLFDVSRFQATVTVGIPLVLLSWIRTYKELAIFTLLGVCSIITSVIVIIWDGYSHTNNSDSTGSSGTVQSNAHTHTNPLPLVLPESMMLFVGPATFIFTLHYCILAMGSEMLQDQPWLVVECGTIDTIDTIDTDGSSSTGGTGTASGNNIETPSIPGQVPVLSEELLSVYQNNNYNLIVNRSRSNTATSIVLADSAQEHIISPHGYSTSGCSSGINDPRKTPKNQKDPKNSKNPLSSGSPVLEIPSEVVVKDNLGPGLITAYISSVLIICFLGVFGYATYRTSDYVR